ncbi:MAG: hypothetical protein D6744_06645 [Planctomycetota bacterium]|nr:MAG: hypothetical protein D6744_06645 [Planctomycetota bacterium]
MQCIREVRADACRDSLDRVQWFYTNLLGMQTWPPNEQIPGGWGVGPLRRGLWFRFRHDPLVDANRRRFVLHVNSLEQLERRLHENGWAYQRTHGLGATDHYLTLHDPTGHRIEIRASQPL